jgi:hypothetical protein
MARKRRLITAQLGSMTLEVDKDRPQSDVRPKQVLAEDAPGVLIVDADHARRDAVVGMLNRIYHVHVADDAIMAIAMCARHKPDVVIRGASDDDERLEQLLVLAMGKDRPPVLALAEIAANAADDLSPQGRRSGVPDAFSLVSAIEQTVGC